MDWQSLKAAGPKIWFDPNRFQGSPVSLPFNTIGGWRDSPSVNWMGNFLTFSYFRSDIFLFKNTGRVRLGPKPPEWPEIPDYEFPALFSEIYACANVVNGQFTTDIHNFNNITNAKINTIDGVEGSQQLTEDLKTIFFSRSWADKRALFYSVHNGYLATEPTLLSLNKGTDAATNLIDNPFLCANGIFLFEDLNRQTNKHQIWQCKQLGVNRFSTPTKFPNINWVDSDITQPWMSPDGKKLVYSINHQSIVEYDLTKKYNPPLNPKPLVNLLGDPNTVAIGEGTMTKYGDLYFVVVFRNGEEMDCDVFMLRGKQ